VSFGSTSSVIITILSDDFFEIILKIFCKDNTAKLNTGESKPDRNTPSFFLNLENYNSLSMTSEQAAPTIDDFLLLQMPVKVDEVIFHLEKIIDWSEANNSAAGFFATLYHKVTCKIKECITNKEFENGERVEKLDVEFANRYLMAFNLWISGKQNTLSWKAAFESVGDNSCIVLQHLLLGMNAHINLDLGIATVQVMKGLPLDDIKNDFNSINAILSAMTDNIEGCLTKINPLMKLLNLEVFYFDEMLV
jgi:hypothetical protein